MRLAVVKLGGSTALEAELDGWLAALAASQLPLVMVPGGGPFADQVREAQARMGFSDKAAHAMAILGMEQFAHVILDRHRRFTPARAPAEMKQALAHRMIPVWLPSSLALSGADIPASWDVTSDALAAWLARQIGAHAVLLIKQSSAFSEADDLESLAEKGVVDAAFASLLSSEVEFWLANPADVETAASLLRSGTLPGVCMRPALVRKAG